MIRERIDALRRLMAEWGWDVAVTVGEDPHNSEYTPKRWCQREFISGFTGSAGDLNPRLYKSMDIESENVTVTWREKNENGFTPKSKHIHFSFMISFNTTCMI